MKYSMSIIVAIFSIVLASSAASASNGSFDRSGLTERAKIQKLIEEIAQSKANFVRNGSAHSSDKAKSHIEYKLNVAGKRVKTARQFIDMLASRSYFSGNPYYMELPSGKRVTSRSWLMKRLYKLEESQKGA